MIDGGLRDGRAPRRAGGAGDGRAAAGGGLLSSRRTTTVVLAFYLVVLTWIILFKMMSPLDVMGTVRSVNLVPLAGATVINGVADYREAVDNVLAFVPFGLLVGMLAPRWPWWRKLAPVAATSLAYEALQFALAAGASDVTDLLANTLGGAIGLGLYALVRRLARSDARALRACNVVALAGAVLLAALVGLLVAANQ